MAYDTTFRKSGDIRPPVQATITRPEDGSAVDLTNASSVLIYARDPDGTLEIDGVTATIVTAADGEVSYTVTSGEFAAAGRYEVEWEVQWAGDGTDSERFPKKNYQFVDVQTELS